MPVNLKQNSTKESVLYDKILTLSRNELFYTKFDLADTFQNRIHLIFIHISFLFIKINQNESQSRKSLGIHPTNLQMENFHLRLLRRHPRFPLFLHDQRDPLGNQSKRFLHNLLRVYFRSSRWVHVLPSLQGPRRQYRNRPQPNLRKKGKKQNPLHFLSNSHKRQSPLYVTRH